LYHFFRGGIDSVGLLHWHKEMEAMVLNKTIPRFPGLYSQFYAGLFQSNLQLSLETLSKGDAILQAVKNKYCAGGK
jgi:hypothetical protein